MTLRKALDGIAVINLIIGVALWIKGLPADAAASFALAACLFIQASR